MALTPEQAKKLFDMGVISEATYGGFSPAPAPVSTPVATPVSTPVVEPEPSKSLLKDFTNKGKLGELLNSQSGDPSLKPPVAPASSTPSTGLMSPASTGVTSRGASGSWNQQGASGSWDEPAAAAPGALASDIVAPSVPNPANARMGNLEAGYNIQQEAIMKGAQAGAAQAAAESAHLQKTLDEVEKQEEENKVRELGRQDRLKADEESLRSAIERYQATPATTQERFANLDTGNKIMSGIALFLGAAPNSSGGNRAVEVMQKAVDADLAKAKQGVNDRTSLYKEMKDTFGDERQAEAATRLAYIQNAQLKTQQIAAQYKAPQIKANAEALYGQLEVAKQKELATFATASQSSPLMQSADQLTKDIMRLPKDLQSKALEERGILEGLEKAQKSIASSYNTVGQEGFGMWTTSGRAARESAKSAVMSTIAANWKGPMSDSDLKRIDGLLPTEWDTKAQIAIKSAKMQEMLNANSKPTPILNGFGLRPKTQAEKYPSRKPN